MLTWKHRCYYGQADLSFSGAPIGEARPSVEECLESFPPERIQFQALRSLPKLLFEELSLEKPLGNTQ